MQQYVVLRQHYLSGGEALINEWHQQFVEHKSQEEKEGGEQAVEKRDKKTILQNIRRMLVPGRPVGYLFVTTIYFVPVCALNALLQACLA